MTENIEKCKHDKNGMCIKCALDEERDLLINKARELTDIDELAGRVLDDMGRFTDRVLRYLELQKKTEKPNHT